MSIWAQRSAAFQEVRDAALARVVDWRWSRSTEFADPRPFVAEREGDPPARLHTKEPANRTAWTRYGLDAGGVPQIAQRFVEPDRIEGEDVLAKDEWWLGFLGRDGRWIVRRVVRAGDDEGVYETETYAFAERYERDERDRIVRIAGEEFSPAAEPTRYEYACAYAGDELVRVTEIRQGVVYEPLREELGAEQALVEAELVRATVAAVERIGRDDPVLAVVIGYEDDLPPLIGIATEADADALWNPADFRHAIGISEELEPADPREFARSVRALERLWSAVDDDAATGRLCAHVARALNARAWPSGTVAADFVAIAVDSTLDELEAQASATAPADRLNRLRERGLLPTGSDPPGKPRRPAR